MGQVNNSSNPIRNIERATAHSFFLEAYLLAVVVAVYQDLDLILRWAKHLGHRFTPVRQDAAISQWYFTWTAQYFRVGSLPFAYQDYLSLVLSFQSYLVQYARGPQRIRQGCVWARRETEIRRRSGNCITMIFKTYSRVVFCFFQRSDLSLAWFGNIRTMDYLLQ
jgi:hypothetical protein